MLENRSFDNVLGWLYDPANAEPYRVAPRAQAFEGVSGKSLSNHVPDSELRVPFARGRVMTDPNPDPGEEFAHVARQTRNGQRMDGFVADYIRNFRETRGTEPSPEEYSIIMHGFPPETVPVLAGLAHHYGVCDHWYSSVPSQTLCNRCFVHCGTSRGFVNNAPNPKWLLSESVTIFNRLSEAGIDWRIFYDELDIVPLSRLTQPTLWDVPERHFQHMDAFHREAAEGTLPPYSFIEPRFFLNHNDAHPPLEHKFLETSSVSGAELLVHDIYRSIRNGKGWNKTMLVITFDEHGGCYDHVVPPPAVPPEPNHPTGEEGFKFDRLGVRVPAIVVSPFTQSGQIAHSHFDHSSLIKTICNRWGLPHLTERDRAARDLSELLSLDEPRGDDPELTPLPYQPSAEASEAPLSELQRLILELVAAYEAVLSFSQEGGLRERASTLAELVKAEHNIHNLETVGQALTFMKTKLQPENGWFGVQHV